MVTEAQQLPLFTQYRENLGIINPASLNGDYLLYENNLSFGASYRIQWVGFDSAPRTQTIRGEYIYNTSGGVALVFGGYLLNDQTGPTGFTGAYGRIAGILSNDPDFNGFSVGLNFGAVQYRVNVSDIRLRQLNDVLTMDDQSKIFPDVGVGAYYYQVLNGGFFDGDYLYAGLSIPQIIGLDLEFTDDTGSFNTKRIQHFYGLLGLYKFFSNDSYLEPSVWVKYTPDVPVNVDINLRYQFEANFWLGTGVSTAGTFHLETGLVLGENIGVDGNLRIGYGFDYSFRSFGPSVGTTHEINVSYAIER